MTATSTWLESEDFADVAFLLWIDGLGLGFCSHDDLAGLTSAWSVATGTAWAQINGGLRIQGAIQRMIELFAAKISPSSLTFSLHDADDDLFPYMFGESRTDIRKTYLRETLNADQTVLKVDDVGQITGLDTLFMGLETFIPTAEDTVLNEWTVERGYRSLFPRAAGTTWARTHEVPSDGGSRPAVTDIPVNFLNRAVGLYVCHRVNGVWSAGFPGTVDNDAELLWAGRIKHYAEAGDGWLDIDCVEITEILQTTIGARMYEGDLAEGAYVAAADAEIRIVVASVNPGPTVYTTYTAQLNIADSTASHQQVASAINAAFADAFIVNAGTHAPATASASISLGGEHSSSEGLYNIQYIDSAIGAGEIWDVWIYLSPIVCKLLGWPNVDPAVTASTGNKAQIIELKTDRDNPKIQLSIAPEPPKRFVISIKNLISGAPNLTVTPDNDTPYTPQVFMPPGFFDADGFLLILGHVIAVEPFTAHTFAVRGELTGMVSRSRSGVALGGEIEEFLSADVGDDAGPIKVRQAWVEPFTLGGAMTRILCSTGTFGYNFFLYDSLPLGLGVAFPSSLLDLDSVLALGDLPYLLVVTAPTPFVKLFESALNIVGRHAVWANGKLTIVSPVESASIADLVYLNEDNKAKHVEGDEVFQAILERTSCDRNPESIRNRMTLRYNAALDGQWLRTVTVNARASQSDYGQVKSAVIDGYGIYDQGAAQAGGAIYWETHVAAAALAYFSRPIAVCTRSYDFNLATQLYPGAKVSVTDSGLIDPNTGTRGVIGLLGWVLSTTFDWATGVGKVTFAFQPDAATTSTATRLGVFAPSARVDETFNEAADEVVPIAASDFTFTNADRLSNGAAASVSAPTTGSVVLPENTLVFLDVMNHHTTAASLAAAPTVTGTGGETWVQIATTTAGVDGTGGNRRLTRYRTMRSADTTTTVTMTFSGSQTQIGWELTWVTGVDTTGTHGAGAMGEVASGNTAGVTDISLEIPLEITDGRNGQVAVFILGANAGLQPRTLWTEVNDFTPGGTSPNRMQTQFRPGAEDAASVTSSGSAGVMAGITSEVVSNPFAVRSIFSAEAHTGASSYVHSIPVKAGRQYIFQVNVPSTASVSISCPTFTFTTDQDFTASFAERFYAIRMSIPSADATLTVTVSRPGSGSAYQIGVVEIWGFDTTVGSGTGIVQSKTETQAGSASPHTFTLASAPASRQNGMLIIYGYANTSSANTTKPGWKNAHHLNLNAGVTTDMAAVWRANADSAPDIGGSPIGGVTRGGIVYEFATAPRVYTAFGAGYTPDTKTLRFKPHEYSLDTEEVDVSWFEAGDAVHIVDLSPPDPDAPAEWFDTLAFVYPATNSVVLTTGLAGWPDRGYFVMEFDDTSTDSAAQRLRGSFIADATTKSTGLAPNDAYQWGGDVGAVPASVLLETDQPYRRLNRAADDVGAALSVHKLHELRDFLNTALAYHGNPVYVNEQFPVASTHVADGTGEIIMYPPVWLPLFSGNTRSLDCRVLVAMNTGTDEGANVRFMTSVDLPVDDGEFEEPSFNGPAWADATVPQSTTYAWRTTTLTVPALVRGTPGGCWLTVTGIPDDPAAGQINLLGIYVAEAAP